MSSNFETAYKYCLYHEENNHFDRDLIETKKTNINEYNNIINPLLEQIDFLINNIENENSLIDILFLIYKLALTCGIKVFGNIEEIKTFINPYEKNEDNEDNHVLMKFSIKQFIESRNLNINSYYFTNNSKICENELNRLMLNDFKERKRIIISKLNKKKTFFNETRKNEMQEEFKKNDELLFENINNYYKLLHNTPRCFMLDLLTKLKMLFNNCDNNLHFNNIYIILQAIIMSIYKISFFKYKNINLDVIFNAKYNK